MRAHTRTDSCNSIQFSLNGQQRVDCCSERTALPTYCTDDYRAKKKKVTHIPPPFYYTRSRFPPLPLCGAYPIVGRCASFLNKLLSLLNKLLSQKSRDRRSGDQVIREDPAVRSSCVRGRGTETSAERDRRSYLVTSLLHVSKVI